MHIVHAMDKAEWMCERAELVASDPAAAVTMGKQSQAVATAALQSMYAPAGAATLSNHSEASPASGLQLLYDATATTGATARR
jgi:hypothetical protein